ncbi:phosphate ABC transporter permease subunit PstC [Ferroacidibacillus organovorans]|uniref:Phosphate transport system permease protein n=1 Tax=Ferroacidibacillus organovorans TaxID=1765683 RepID=A0A162UGF4_9BACL|nr:phosphate ABC transporter permease subunit PstC [Ferroacidibacillus organovorans]KYP81736.1 phosphate ABC transporter permease subunit PstC [Ferroacidibacillus organovorans]OPG16352.1 phosphate ABC transporter permease subunit PstC [Ferroacidibacillus organovorans]
MWNRITEQITQTWVRVSLLVTLTLLVALLIMLIGQSMDAFHAFSWNFLVTSTWDPVHRVFGALPFLYGTVVTSIFALLFAGIIGIGSSVFLVYVLRGPLRNALGLFIELLAAIPSVVYGLWGLYVLAPWLQRTGEPFLHKHLGFLPMFSGATLGVGFLAGGLILTIMILPTITAISRDVLQAVPAELIEGAYALGATRVESIRHVGFPFARSGIIGALMLGFGRAVGETIAVTMVIGNRPQIVASLFAPGYTMASVIANEFTEATYPLYTSSLYEIGLILLLTTVLFYGGARFLVWRMTRTV